MNEYSKLNHLNISVFKHKAVSTMILKSINKNITTISHSHNKSIPKTTIKAILVNKFLVKQK